MSPEEMRRVYPESMTAADAAKASIDAALKCIHGVRHPLDGDIHHQVVLKLTEARLWLAEFLKGS